LEIPVSLLIPTLDTVMVGAEEYTVWLEVGAEEEDVGMTSCRRLNVMLSKKNFSHKMEFV
jgi:hypothetical protein